MGVTVDDELAVLRARAYGADADIRDDPEAMARLRLLEDQERSRRDEKPPLPSSAPERPPLPVSVPVPTGSSSPAHGAAAPAVTPAPGAATVTVAPLSGDGSRVSEAVVPGRVPRRRPPGRVLAACALTAVVTAAVTVPATLWTSSFGDRPYAVLEPTVGVPNGVFFSPESNPLRYEDFLGLEISVGGLDYRAGERCILIDLDPQPAEYSENTRGACSPAGFGAVVDIPAVEIAQSSEAREALGDITALRFELVGDKVHVFAARVPADSDES